MSDPWVAPVIPIRPAREPKSSMDDSASRNRHERWLSLETELQAATRHILTGAPRSLPAWSGSTLAGSTRAARTRMTKPRTGPGQANPSAGCTALQRGGRWRCRGTPHPLAAAIELLHNFTLIHDDIQDRSPNRRHRATVWRVWGDAQAINAGDALFAAAQLALLDIRGRVRRIRSLLALLDAVQPRHDRDRAGQVSDLEFEGQERYPRTTISQ